MGAEIQVGLRLEWGQQGGTRNNGMRADREDEDQQEGTRKNESQ